MCCLSTITILGYSMVIAYNTVLAMTGKDEDFEFDFGRMF